jgi:hypothetical protein
VIVAIHQPQYLSWVQYCDKADQCDILVHLDDVQFHRGGVQNRNNIKTNKGARWLTVPVTAHLTTTIREVTIADRTWRKQHLHLIEHNYCHAPFFSLFQDGLRPILQAEWTNLCELNIAVTDWLFSTLGIHCKKIRASELRVSGAKDSRIIGICEAVGGSIYLSGQGASAYQDATAFQERGIELRYQEYKNPTYPQCFPEIGFVPDLTALDLILNAGPQAREIMLSGRMKAGPTVSI